MDFKIYLILFIIYSIIGWLTEVLLGLYNRKKFVNRGFLLGPYCPIYGTGAILVICLFSSYLDRPFGLFCIVIITFASLEYITSFIFEKLFKARWWDYSQKRFNINGRICLEFVIPFGIMGLIMMYILNPFFMKLLTSFSDIALLIISICLGLIFITDIIISLVVIIKVRKTVVLAIMKDNTEEITRNIRRIIGDRARATKRLIRSFPNVEKLLKIFIK